VGEEYHLEQESIIWRCVYHLEGVGVGVSSGAGKYYLEEVCIIWKGRVSSRAGEYHLEGVRIIWKGMV
jgi:hypothetical protein